MWGTELSYFELISQIFLPKYSQPQQCDMTEAFGIISNLFIKSNQMLSQNATNKTELRMKFQEFA